MDNNENNLGLQDEAKVSVDMVADKIRVAEVIGEPQTGELTSVMNFYKQINKDRFSVDFFTYGKSKYDAYVNGTGGRVFYYNSVLRIFSSTFKLIKYFRKYKYDIVHVHLTSYSLVPLIAAFLAGVKVRICHAHKVTNKYEGFKHYFKMMIKPLTRLFATHYAGCCKDSNMYMYGKKGIKKSFIINNAVDLNMFSRTKIDIDMRKEYGLTNEKIIGTAGIYERQKNQEFLIESFAKMKEKDVHLFILGEGSLEEKLKKRAEELNVQDRVHFTYSYNIIEFYAIFDVFCLPSKYEGLPLVLIEAQGMNLPCIVSNNVTKDANITGNCKYVDIDSPDEFSRVLSDSLKLSKYDNGIELLKEAGYDITDEVKKLEEYYEKIVKKKKRK